MTGVQTCALPILDEALAAYQNLSVRYPNSAVLNDAKLGIARIYEAKNQPELALAQYEELSKPGLMSTATAEAMARKKDLLLKNPELAQTNTAFAIGTTQVVAANTNLPAATPTNVIAAATNPAAAPANPPTPAP